MSGVVVKLGGSVVTEKASAELAVREGQVRRLARELQGAATCGPLVLVHGAGSFGHQIVSRTGLHLGLGEGLAPRLALGETQRLQYDLDSQICRLMLEEGLAVMPCQASASAILEAGRLVSMDTAAIELMVARGMIPVLYGVPAMDRAQGCAILSGDQIAPFLAGALGIDLLIHATNVDGVFDGDPNTTPGASRIDRIDRGSWERVRHQIRGSSAVDVTGGMEGKVASLIELARRGLRTRIIDATIAGRLAAALAGEPVGTLIEWEGEEA